MTLTAGSLFAGIGGFDLGFERAGFKTIWQVEIDKYCRRVLARHFPDAERFGDIRECGAHNLKPVDVICGGFPCTDISSAAAGGNGTRRTGLDGERSGLWRHFSRVVGELRPRFVVVENVTALLYPMRDDDGRISGPAPIAGVLRDLAGLGYDAEWRRLPAAAFGADHLRWRTFVVAYPASLRLPRPWVLWHGIHPAESAYREASDVVDAFQRQALPFVCGRHHGFSSGLAERALTALGNAIAPQIAEWIARGIVGAMSKTTPLSGNADLLPKGHSQECL